ncbi:GmrSD restriction endonuclease domain-containing protein [Candidatus Poriferisodalis sp.]|uniref:GmrSD restriction endonuclease domain-containing protein n=1 Tax=Candidatus Poriferisodalis sp. TaxID=3101277 RepID=UPI003B01B63E
MTNRYETIKYDTTKISETIRDSIDGELVLPVFQRNFDWSRAQQRELLGSILSFLPIGSLLVLKGPEGEFKSRSFACHPEIPCKSTVTYLLDGQQRLTCTTTFFSDIFRLGVQWRKHHESITQLLQYRWFLKIVASEQDSEDYFGYRNLMFEEEPADPEAMRDLVSWRKINRSDSSLLPWHPGWPKWHDGTDQTEARHEAAEYFANECIVPLWELCGDAEEEPLHQQTLRLLAAAQRERLISTLPDLPRAVQGHLDRLNPSRRGHLPGTVEALSPALYEIASKWQTDVSRYLEASVQQPIARIVLPVNEMARSISIFETINQGGTPLSTYDLVVARMARADRATENLSDMLAAFNQDNSCPLADVAVAGAQNAASATLPLALTDYIIDAKKGEITGHFKQIFLQVMAVRHSLKRESYSEQSLRALNVEVTKRSEILELSPEWIRDDWQHAARSVVLARAFLMMRCGITRSDQLRNQLVMLPLAVALGSEGFDLSPKNLNALEYWYWCSVLGGRYREQQNRQSIEDTRRILQWLMLNHDNPFADEAARALSEPGFSDSDVLLQRGDDSRVTADVGNYLPQYVLSRCPLDLLDEDCRLEAWNSSLSLELHHIVPLGSVTKVRESAAKLRKEHHVLNSPVNLTYITLDSNRAIGEKSPVRYLEDVDAAARAGHFLPPYDFCRTRLGDDEEGYVEILERRYDSIKDALAEELASLVS